MTPDQVRGRLVDIIGEYEPGSGSGSGGAGTLLRRYVHGPGIDEPLVQHDTGSSPGQAAKGNMVEGAAPLAKIDKAGAMQA